MPTLLKRASKTAKVPKIVRNLCSLVAELESLFDRRFTLDGHLVGSIGEVLAADMFGLTLLPMNAATHDAKAANGTLVQIKTTQGRSVGLSSEPDHLLVVQLDENGSIEPVYNGPGRIAWEAAGKMQKTGQCWIGLAKLRALMNAVPAQAMLRVVQ